MMRRIYLAWQHAVAVASSLTVPNRDVAASDRAVEMALRESRLFRAVDAVGAGGRRAWPEARTRIWLRQLAAEWAAWSEIERVRAAGVALVACGITAVLAGAASAPMQPLAWVLPAALAGLGLFVAIAAAPLARAIADRTS
jgi:hypothetical protein